MRIRFKTAIKQDSFKFIIKYIYTGKITLEEKNISELLDFLELSYFLKLHKLQEHLSENILSKLNVNNCLEIFERAVLLHQYRMIGVIEKLIDKNAVTLQNQNKLITITSNHLAKIIERDTFNIPEIKIFNIVHNWHIHNNRSKKQDHDQKLISKIREGLLCINNKIDLCEFEYYETKKLVYSTSVLTRIETNTQVTTTTTTTHATTTSLTTTTKITSNIIITNKLNRLASGSLDNTIKIWNIENGECIRTLTGHSNWVISVELISQNRLASGSLDNTIKIWNIDNGECIRTLTGHRNFVSSVELISQNRLASGSLDKTIKIWNIDNGECFRTLTGHINCVSSVEIISPNRLASGSADKTIKIWNIDNGECIQTLTGHINCILSVELISPNRLASGSRDNTIKIWNIDNGECIRTLTGHKEIVLSVELISPNRLASGSWDNTIKIWNIDTGECIRTLTSPGNWVRYNFYSIFRRIFGAEMKTLFYFTDKLIRFIN